MAYPYDDNEPSLCRSCGKDIPENYMIKICAECIRKEQQDTRKIPGVRYGRDKSGDPSF